MSRRNLTDAYKKQVADKAIKLKEKSPHITWTAISERFIGVGSPRHLRSIIEKYRPDYYGKGETDGQQKL